MEELRIYNTLDSTNVEARRLLTNPSIIPHGTTLVALAQTGGKGQQGRSWHTEAGRHLAMTVILKPEDAVAADLPRFSKFISLAIVMTLEAIDPRLHPRIKWPNDIYVQDKKICGILIENALSGNRIQHIIAGIGINVNETSFPADLPNATSLRMICEKEFNIIEIAKAIQENILMYTSHIPRGCEAHRGTFFSALNANNIQSERNEGYNFEGQNFEWYLYKRNEKVDFNHEGKIISGIITDIDNEGRLVLQIDGALKSFYTHELKWII